MEKILLAVLIFTSFNLFAQDNDEEYNEKHKDNDKKHHNDVKYKKDYFTVGLYTGSYIGKGSLTEVNFYFNSISTEIEYYKFTDLSIYIKGLYRLSNYRVYHSFSPDDYTDDYKNYKLIVGFGGRYYANKRGMVKPYLQAGINQDTEYIKGPGYSGSYSFRYFMNIGIGFTVKISSRFNFDMKYDLNKTLDKDVYYSFNGFSVLAGLKYNL